VSFVDEQHQQQKHRALPGGQPRAAVPTCALRVRAWVCFFGVKCAILNSLPVSGAVSFESLQSSQSTTEKGGRLFLGQAWASVDSVAPFGPYACPFFLCSTTPNQREAMPFPMVFRRASGTRLFHFLPCPPVHWRAILNGPYGTSPGPGRRLRRGPLHDNPVLDNRGQCRRGW